ncbi:MAG: hypothetical protein K2L23_01530 [Odoribacter sp.]|nr:hypothetical protein [Odoribacter sp.]
MQKEKINLSEKRTLSDELTVTFQFIKQEFKSLIVSFSVIVLPLIVAGLFLQGAFLKEVLKGADVTAFANNGSGWITLLVNYLLAVITLAWLQLFALSYLRLYSDKYLKQEETRISWRALLKMMVRYSGRFCVLGIIYLLLVLVSFLFFIIPGIYVSVIFVFSPYFLVVRDRKLFSVFSDSADLCRGEWWGTFGYLLLCSLILSMLNYVFNLPYWGVFLEAYLTERTPGLFELTFANVIKTIGQNLTHVVLLVGIGVRFFSRLEAKEHRTLLDKIGQIGLEEQTESSEEKL